MKLTAYEDTRYPIYDIDLSLPPDQRWNHFAIKEATNIGRMLDDVVEMCGKHIDEAPAAFRPFIKALAYGSTFVAGPIVNWVAGMFGKDYVYNYKNFFFCCSVRDKVSVGSLLMITLMTKMEYCTDILR